MENTPAQLYDRLCDPAALRVGWARVLANADGPGGDHVSVHDFGVRVDAEIERLAADLVHGT